MTTLTIEIKNPKVIPLPENLEALGLIEIVSRSPQKKRQNLAKSLMGSISPDEADAMHKQLKEMRGLIKFR